MSCLTYTPAILPLVVPQGADYEYIIKITIDGDLVDLTGSTFQSHIRKTATNGTKTGEFTFTDGDTVYEKKMTLSAATSAAFTVGDKPTDAASRYVYDVEWTDSGGDVIRLFQGSIVFDANVTRGS